MKLTDEERKSVVQFRMEKANDFIKTIEQLILNKKFDLQ